MEEYVPPKVSRVMLSCKRIPCALLHTYTFVHRFGNVPKKVLGGSLLILTAPHLEYEKK
jgi:hypothetical protein